MQLFLKKNLKENYKKNKIFVSLNNLKTYGQKKSERFYFDDEKKNQTFMIKQLKKLI